VLRAWPDVVGAEIARHARPARRTKDGDLIVHCADAAWTQTLTMMAAELAERLAAALPGEAPRALRFRVGTVAPAQLGPPPLPPPPPAVVAEAEALAAAIGDERLRAAAERVIAHSLRPPDSA
jgi:hypothetical protein